MKTVLLASFVAFGLFSCGRTDMPIATEGNYFSLRRYFQDEADRLNSKNPYVEKSVAKNDTIEKKKINIKNWRTELGLFIESDINKPSWKDGYETTIKPPYTIYTAVKPGLRTRQIRIEQTPSGDVKSILIKNRTNNTLYESSEQLEYFPDSLYKIVKKQEVIIIGNHDYIITGKIDK